MAKEMEPGYPSLGEGLAEDSVNWEKGEADGLEKGRALSVMDKMAMMRREVDGRTLLEEQEKEEGEERAKGETGPGEDLDLSDPFADPFAVPLPASKLKDGSVGTVQGATQPIDDGPSSSPLRETVFQEEDKVVRHAGEEKSLLGSTANRLGNQQVEQQETGGGSAEPLAEPLAQKTKTPDPLQKGLDTEMKLLFQELDDEIEEKEELDEEDQEEEEEEEEEESSRLEGKSVKSLEEEIRREESEAEKRDNESETVTVTKSKRKKRRRVRKEEENSGDDSAEDSRNIEDNEEMLLLRQIQEEHMQEEEEESSEEDAEGAPQTIEPHDENEDPEGATLNERMIDLIGDTAEDDEDDDGEGSTQKKGRSEVAGRSHRMREAEEIVSQEVRQKNKEGVLAFLNNVRGRTQRFRRPTVRELTRGLVNRSNRFALESDQHLPSGERNMSHTRHRVKKVPTEQEGGKDWSTIRPKLGRGLADISQGDNFVEEMILLAEPGKENFAKERRMASKPEVFLELEVDDGEILAPKDDSGKKNTTSSTDSGPIPILSSSGLNASQAQEVAFIVRQTELRAQKAKKRRAKELARLKKSLLGISKDNEQQDTHKLKKKSQKVIQKNKEDPGYARDTTLGSIGNLSAGEPITGPEGSASSDEEDNLFCGPLTEEEAAAQTHDAATTRRQDTITDDNLESKTDNNNDYVMKQALASLPSFSKSAIRLPKALPDLPVPSAADEEALKLAEKRAEAELHKEDQTDTEDSQAAEETAHGELPTSTSSQGVDTALGNQNSKFAEPQVKTLGVLRLSESQFGSNQSEEEYEDVGGSATEESEDSSDDGMSDDDMKDESKLETVEAALARLKDEANAEAEARTEGRNKEEDANGDPSLDDLLDMDEFLEDAEQPSFLAMQQDDAKDSHVKMRKKKKRKKRREHPKTLMETDQKSVKSSGESADITVDMSEEQNRKAEGMTPKPFASSVKVSTAPNIMATKPEEEVKKSVMDNNLDSVEKIPEKTDCLSSSQEKELKQEVIPPAEGHLDFGHMLELTQSKNSDTGNPTTPSGHLESPTSSTIVSESVNEEAKALARKLVCEEAEEGEEDETLGGSKNTKRQRTADKDAEISATQERRWEREMERSGFIADDEDVVAESDGATLLTQPIPVDPFGDDDAEIEALLSRFVPGFSQSLTGDDQSRKKRTISQTGGSDLKNKVTQSGLSLEELDVFGAYDAQGNPRRRKRWELNLLEAERMTLHARESSQGSLLSDSDDSGDDEREKRRLKVQAKIKMQLAAKNKALSPTGEATSMGSAPVSGGLGARSVSEGDSVEGQFSSSKRRKRVLLDESSRHTLGLLLRTNRSLPPATLSISRSSSALNSRSVSSPRTPVAVTVPGELSEASSSIIGNTGKELDESLLRRRQAALTRQVSVGIGRSLSRSLSTRKHTKSSSSLSSAPLSSLVQKPSSLSTIPCSSRSSSSSSSSSSLHQSPSQSPSPPSLPNTENTNCPDSNNPKTVASQSLSPGPQVQLSPSPSQDAATKRKASAAKARATRQAKAKAAAERDAPAVPHPALQRTNSFLSMVRSESANSEIIRNGAAVYKKAGKTLSSESSSVSGGKKAHAKMFVYKRGGDSLDAFAVDQKSRQAAVQPASAPKSGRVLSKGPTDFAALMSELQGTNDSLSVMAPRGNANQRSRGRKRLPEERVNGAAKTGATLMALLHSKKKLKRGLKKKKKKKRSKG